MSASQVAAVFRWIDQAVRSKATAEPFHGLVTEPSAVFAGGGSSADLDDDDAFTRAELVASVPLLFGKADCKLCVCARMCCTHALSVPIHACAARACAIRQLVQHNRGNASARVILVYCFPARWCPFRYTTSSCAPRVSLYLAQDYSRTSLCTVIVEYVACMPCLCILQHLFLITHKVNAAAIADQRGTLRGAVCVSLGTASHCVGSHSAD